MPNRASLSLSSSIKASNPRTSKGVAKEEATEEAEDHEVVEAVVGEVAAAQGAVIRLKAVLPISVSANLRPIQEAASDKTAHSSIHLAPTTPDQAKVHLDKLNSNSSSSQVASKRQWDRWGCHSTPSRWARTR